MDQEKRQKVLKDLASVINRHSLENKSDTPDFILASYLLDCLESFAQCSRRREQWYGVRLEPGFGAKSSPDFVLQAELTPNKKD